MPMILSEALQQKNKENITKYTNTLLWETSKPYIPKLIPVVQVLTFKSKMDTF